LVGNALSDQKLYFIEIMLTI